MCVGYGCGGGVLVGFSYNEVFLVNVSQNMKFHLFNFSLLKMRICTAACTSKNIDYTTLQYNLP